MVLVRLVDIVVVEASSPSAAARSVTVGERGVVDGGGGVVVVVTVVVVVEAVVVPFFRYKKSRLDFSFPSPTLAHPIAKSRQLCYTFFAYLWRHFETL